MVANASPSKLAAYCRERLLSEQAAWDLVVNCPSCEKWVCQRIGALARGRPDGALGSLLQRLRCSGCGKAYPDAWVKQGERWIPVEGRASC